MIALQFLQLKVGDRFFYEMSTNPLYHYNQTQINEIRKMTVARIVCDNLDVNGIQINPFFMPDPITNPMVSCSDLPTIDYTLFTQ